MTMASDLAQVACRGVSTPGVVHDPLSPLVLGDVNTGNYVVMTFDTINNVWNVVVVESGNSSTYTFDSLGNILVNDQNIVDIPAIHDAVTAAQNAAAAAAVSANQSANSATTSSGYATTASEAANAADNSATLSQQFASAPDGTALPGGGVSAAVSAARADTTAQTSRDLDLGGTVTANETFQAGFCDTERQVTATGLVTITIPVGIYTNTANRSRWAAYRLRNATGSIKVVGASGGSNIITPVVKASAVQVHRYKSSGGVYPEDILLTLATPALSFGKILVIYAGTHQGNPTPSTLNIQANIASAEIATWVVARALPAHPSFNQVPDWAVFTVDVGAFTAKDVHITVHGGDGCQSQFLFACAIEDCTSVAQVASLTTNVAASNFQAAITSVSAQSTQIGVVFQRGISTETAFSSFDPNLALISGLSGNSVGADDVLVSDSDRTKNFVYGVGQGVQNVAGSFTGKGNLSSAVGPGGFCLVSFAPRTGTGTSAVVLELEGSRDTMSVPYGVMELWFRPDGQTVGVRTPKP